jgi:3-oxoacyl-[acyl-carrier-protein] synthase II
MISHKVVVTGMGVVSPIGIGVDAFFQGMIEGKNGVSEVTGFDASGYPARFGGQVKDFDPIRHLDTERARTQGRGSQLAISAARMALIDADLNRRLDPERTGICLGSTYGEWQLIENMNDVWIQSDPDQISTELIVNSPHHAILINMALEIGVKGPSSMMLNGCAASGFAIGHASELIRSGHVDVALAGGVEPFSRVGFAGFNRLLAMAPRLCQPFDKNRKGMILGEWAAVIVLESLEHAERWGAMIQVEIAGYGFSCDAYHITGTHPEGRGAVKAMEKALRSSQLMPSDVGYINAHGTGTPTNDKAETIAIKKVFGEHAKQIPISSTKSMVGHSMGASGAVEAVACALVLKKGLIPPTINYFEPDPDCDLDYVPNTARAQNVDLALSNSFAFGGNCFSLILRKLA